MVAQVARAFVAAVAAEHSLRLALGRFLSGCHRSDGVGGRETPSEHTWDGSDVHEEIKWRWGRKGVFQGPLREFIIAGLRKSSSVVVVAGGAGRACECGAAMIRPADLSEIILSDAEAFEVWGRHFAGIHTAAVCLCF